ncbi:EpsG family protein [Vibrio cincinnatiensis]|uniref:EpsG family protein n=1 Tax=Vibrio cincinnatiensis TaxID=675 RepID=UPI003B986E69|nr:EpsG family protein [Vibrio cincinnatiensis]MCG3763045.1 EpsG family protein [Vibrio cincinnatiensis]
MIYSFLAIFGFILTSLRSNYFSIFIVSLICALLISGFDLPDNDAYFYMYDTIPKLSLDILLGNDYIFNEVYGEVYYKYTMSFFKLIGLGYFSFRLIVIFIIVYVKLAFYKYFINDWRVFSLCVLVYLSLFFYVESYILRQSLATSLLCVAFVCLYNRHNLAFSIIVVLSFFFHSTGILALPLLLFVNKRFSKNFYLTLLVLIFAIGIIGVKSLLVQISHLIPSDYIFSKIIRYSDNEYGESLGVFRLSVLIYTSFFVYAVYHYHNENRFFVLNVYIMALLFLVGFNDFGVIGDRIFRLFAFIIPLVMSSLIYSFSENYWKLNLVIVIVIFSILSFGFSMGYTFNYVGY